MVNQHIQTMMQLKHFKKSILYECVKEFINHKVLNHKSYLNQISAQQVQESKSDAFNLITIQLLEYGGSQREFLDTHMFNTVKKILLVDKWEPEKND